MAYSVSHQSEYKKIVTKQPGYLANMDLVLPFFLPATYQLLAKTGPFSVSRTQIFKYTYSSREKTCLAIMLHSQICSVSVI